MTSSSHSPYRAGGVFAIGASGLVLTYTTALGIFNFAHGGVFARSGVFLYWQLPPAGLGMPAPLALFIVLFNLLHRCSASS